MSQERKANQRRFGERTTFGGVPFPHEPTPLDGVIIFLKTIARADERKASPPSDVQAKSAE